MELTEEIAARAGELAGAHALCGADAAHLASALAMGTDDLLFAAWDRRLRSGVEMAGIRLARRPSRPHARTSTSRCHHVVSAAVPSPSHTGDAEAVGTTDRPSALRPA